MQLFSMKCIPFSTQLSLHLALALWNILYIGMLQNIQVMIMEAALLMKHLGVSLLFMLTGVWSTNVTFTDTYIQGVPRKKYH